MSTSKKSGRPAKSGFPVGLKPYLSVQALALLESQNSKSDYVAQLLEREAMSLPLPQVVIDRIQESVAALNTVGIDLVNLNESRKDFVVSQSLNSGYPYRFLKTIKTSEDSYRVIPVNSDVTISFLGHEVKESGLHLIRYYLVSTPDGSFGVEELYYQLAPGESQGATAVPLSELPEYLMVKLLPTD